MSRAFCRHQQQQHHQQQQQSQHRADNNSNLNSNLNINKTGDSSSASESSESETPEAQGRANAKALPKVKALPKALTKAQARRDPEYLQALALFETGAGPCLRAGARRQWPELRSKSSAAQFVLVQRGRWEAMSGLPSPLPNDMAVVQEDSLTAAYVRAFREKDEDDLYLIFLYPEGRP